jgi:hypothetical protein
MNNAIGGVLIIELLIVIVLVLRISNKIGG